MNKYCVLWICLEFIFVPHFYYRFKDPLHQYLGTIYPNSKTFEWFYNKNATHKWIPNLFEKKPFRSITPSGCIYVHNLLKFEWYQTRDSYNSNRKTALLWLDCTNNSAVNECIHGRNAVDNILHSVTRIYRSDCLDLVK